MIEAPGFELHCHTMKFYVNCTFVNFVLFIACKIKSKNCACLNLACEYCLRFSLQILAIFTIVTFVLHSLLLIRQSCKIKVILLDAVNCVINIPVCIIYISVNLMNMNLC